VYPQTPPALQDVVALAAEVAGHAIVLPHWPHALQTWYPLAPEHCVAFGVHTGVEGQEQAPHPQVELHDCVPYVLQLCVAFREHAPWPVHVPLLCHAPLAPQVCVSVPQLPQATGFVCPGAHVPAQVAVLGPATHVELLQVTSAVQTPLVLHLSTPFVDAEHRVVPGLHCPAHAPATHALSLQGVGVPHMPDTHACVAELPEHCMPPAAQLPVHTPAVQVEAAQSTAAPHAPSDPQT
jgi:hypothetical protein